ncbi:hypothetical protein [Deinococcus sp. YIM 77859]|uniref:hypothetical protein n=1 Tax=Deinococcus sp. YIM 77859 TaxID=1540221 RepID=UPI00068B9AA8|nr:hypothetical protein [Deinococcus sp. YIM 77859]
MNDDRRLTSDAVRRLVDDGLDDLRMLGLTAISFLPAKVVLLNTGSFTGLLFGEGLLCNGANLIPPTILSLQKIGLSFRLR